MVTLTIVIELDDSDFEAGWSGSASEFEESVAATLRELIGDDGCAYKPEVMFL